MSLLVVIVALLLAGALGLLYFPWSSKGAVDRDALNRALYQSRLQELAQERGEDNPALVVEMCIRDRDQAHLRFPGTAGHPGVGQQVESGGGRHLHPSLVDGCPRRAPVLSAELPRS